MISARDLIRVLRFPLQEVSDWISLARPSQLDYGALAEVSLYLAGGSCEVSHSSIHPSAWKGNSANFALTEFSEVVMHARLLRGSYLALRPHTFHSSALLASSLLQRGQHVEQVEKGQECVDR